mmetsp:Transcript_46540/g.120440  ORF Transcript_46540/g.120440 Transcript_46540/m.120440 type:complete len:596 (+) Transcript_46540:103-1890(+)
MPLKCRSGLPANLRREVTFWTSVGIVAVCCVASIVAEMTHDGSIKDRPLRRVSSYPTDKILGSEPYEDAPAVRKIGIIVHLIGIGYMLLGLNTVCDVYFTGALEIMVEEWKIKPDVAGATFMAAGGSAPELFTSLIGATITENDVGFGTIVGSAVFNVLFVIGACGWVSKEAIDLSWWPLFRDCTYYIVGLILLAMFAMDEEIQVWEAAILFAAYIVYCCIMYNNSWLEAKTDTEFMKRMTRGGSNEVTPVTDAPPKLELESDQSTDADAKARAGGHGSKSRRVVPCDDRSDSKRSTNGKDSKNNKLREAGEAPSGGPEQHIGVVQDADVMEAASINEDELTKPGKAASNGAGDDIPTLGEPAQPDEKSPNGDEKTGEEKKDDDDDDDEDPVEEMMEIPAEGKWRYIWFISAPIYYMLYYGLPKPRATNFLRVFSISLIWIALFASLLVWLVEIVGGALWVDPIIQGFTVLAAGTSIPDMASSVAVARKGEGDMAVSSSIGSNIFDILVGLPIPWMIKILLVERDVSFFVTLQSPYLAVHVLLLLSMVFAVVLSIHCLGWRLNRALGLCMGVLYMIFLFVAIVVEWNQPEWLRMS